MTATHQRSLDAVVGQDTYLVWVNMLRALVPQGRTHHLAPLVAGMLHYAVTLTEEQSGDEAEEHAVGKSLREASEAIDPGTVKGLLHDVIDQLFRDAGVRYQRTSARGEAYSIADSVYDEFIHWFDMPWEA